MPSLRILRAVGVLAVIVALNACSYTKLDTGTFTRPAEQDGRVLVETAAFQGVTPTRVTYTDPTILEEYVLYRSQMGQAEVLFSEILPRYRRKAVIEFDKLISASVPMWRFNQGQTIRYSESFPVENEFTSFWVQPYRQVEAGRDCAGFSSRWDIRADDPESRPSKIMFGYHCAPKGTAFDAAAATALIKAIQIRGISVPLRVESAYSLNKEVPAPPKDAQNLNLVLAQDGGGGGIAGLPEFPLLFSRHYRSFDGRFCTLC
jgi:hypothetical protein